MTDTDAVDLMREAIVVTMKVGGPILVVTLVVGLAISVLQALTQIQEQTLVFVPKTLVVFGALILLLPFMLGTMITYTESLADRIVAIEQNDD